MDSDSSVVGLKIGLEIGLEKRSYLVHFLVIFFGSSAWIAINGLWVQTPLLVNKLPEAWDLPSYIVILTQVANIGPLVYGLLQKYNVKVSEKMCIHFIMGLGTLCSLLLANLWDQTAVIFGKETSVVLLILTACMAIVDCTSSVLYFPFITLFEPLYLRSLMIGEGLSGLIPSFAAIVQGVGGNKYCVNVTLPDGSTKMTEAMMEPRFSISTFFYFLTFLAILSWMSFYILTRISKGKVKRIIPSPPSETNLILEQELSNHRMVRLLVIQGFCCFIMNGVLSALSTYSTLPYGNVTYHLATTLNVISGPVAVFLAFFLQTERSYENPILPLLSIGCFFVGYILFLACSSPAPPLQHHWFGSLLVILSWVTYHGTFSYVKACIAGRLRQSSFNGKKALFYYGVATQVGSLLGALFIFTIMNTTKTFKSYHPCNNH